MPLLMCPNCDGSMQSISRSGVEIDMCPSCRGVWLDRGELEKLLSAGREAEVEERQTRERFEKEIESFHSDPEGWRRRHPYDEHAKRYRYDGDDYRYKKKRKFDIFDIFD